jgi:hypothetical protein
MSMGGNEYVTPVPSPQSERSCNSVLGM